MKRYLLDTDICVFFLRGNPIVTSKINAVGQINCFASEITIAELKFGAEKSNNPDRNRITIEEFAEDFSVLPIYPSLAIYAKEKVRLEKTGKIIDDFDLLIGSTAITTNLIMVTNNVSHFSRIKGIIIENWIK